MMKKKEERMGVCGKHKEPFRFYCKKCCVLICDLCIEEHGDQGHPAMSLAKYMSTIVIPKLDSRLQDIQGQGLNEYTVLVQQLAQTAVRMRQLGERLEKAVVSLGKQGSYADPRVQVGRLKQQLEAAVQGSNIEVLAQSIEALSNNQLQLGLGDAERFELKSLIEVHQTLIPSLQKEEEFASALESFSQKFSRPLAAMIHNIHVNDLRTLHVYNPVHKVHCKFTIAAAAATTEHIATAQIENRIFITGGCWNKVFVKTAFEVTVHDEAHFSQRQLADMLVPKNSHAMTSYRDRILVSAGGINGKTTLNSCEIYNIANNTWTLAVPLNYPRENPYVCVAGNSWVYCFGGYGTKPAYWIERMNMEVMVAHWEVLSTELIAPFKGDSHGGGAIQLDENSILIYGGWRVAAASMIYSIPNNKFTTCSKLAAEDDSFSHCTPMRFGDHLYAIAADTFNLHIYSIADNTWSVVPPGNWMKP